MVVVSQSTRRQTISIMKIDYELVDVYWALDYAAMDLRTGGGATVSIRPATGSENDAICCDSNCVLSYKGQKMGAVNCVISMSGGKDSTATALVAIERGTENLRLFLLPLPVTNTATYG